MAAGDIARRLDLAPNALSFHLKDLTYVGLIDSRPSGRFVIYSAVFPVINALMAYLTENCCGGADCGGAASSRDHLRSVVNQPARTTPAWRKAAAGKSGSVRARSKR